MFFTIVFLFNILIAAWFYNSAKKIGRSKFVWFFIGLLTCFVLGILFLKFGEIYILPNTVTVSDVIENRLPKLLWEIATMALISGYAYMIHSIFLAKKVK